MKQNHYNFSSGNCTIYLDASFDAIGNIVQDELVFITDEHVHMAHKEKFAGHSCIVIPAGEQFKNQATVDKVIAQQIELKAGRQTFIIGVGGGVVTDIAGYVASVYMRGLKFGFVPTSILAMVDASIGGKNGIDAGHYKNMVGVIRQPQFILYDASLLKTLPMAEWINGFAEVIKHACIKDAEMFEMLEQNTIDTFYNGLPLLKELIERNVSIKTAVVLNDEFEKGERKQLNFGHTIGHAIENMQQLPHGHAVSIGMMAAAKISEEINGFYSAEKERLSALLSRYQLPVSIQYDKEALLQMMQADKKRNSGTMNFILLNRIGEAVIKPIPMQQLTDLVNQVL